MGPPGPHLVHAQVHAGTPSTLSIASAGCGGKKGSDAIGIPECDDYVAKITTCASKLGSMGDGLKKQTKMIADDWRKDAKDPAMKPEMAKACTQATEAAKKAYTDCTF